MLPGSKMKKQTLLRCIVRRGGHPTLHTQCGLPVMETDKNIGKHVAFCRSFNLDVSRKNRNNKCLCFLILHHPVVLLRRIKPMNVFYTLSTGQNSLLGEEQKLHKGHRHEYYIGNIGNGKREWGIKHM